MDVKKERFWALVACAGQGVRAGQPLPKQYAQLAGRAVVAHTLAALEQVEAFAGILVVVSPDDQLFKMNCPDFTGQVAAVGGASRAASVTAGLKALLKQGAQSEDWVLVHDAARCLLKPDWVSKLINACKNDEVGGILAQPVPDTLKKEVDGRIQQTISREHIWQAQTPQMFCIGALSTALEQAEEKGLTVTDEASAMEEQGFAPLLVEGSAENFKLTYPEDFKRAELILKQRERNEV